MADNTVALGIRGPQVAEGGSTAFNPLWPIQALEGVGRIQNMQNQNRLFQQEFTAKQRLGEIMATSPDAETGMNRAMQDPIAAPFATQAFSQFREGLLSQARYNEILGNQANSALETVIKNSPIGVMDPTQYQAYVKARFALLPDAVQQRAATGFNMYMNSLTDGLDQLPMEQRGAELQRRFSNIALGSGAMSPETMRGIYGQPAPGVEMIRMPDGRELPFTRVQPPMGPGYLAPPNLTGMTPPNLAGGAPTTAAPAAIPPAGTLVQPPPAGAPAGTPGTVPGQQTQALPAAAPPAPDQTGAVAPGIGQTTLQKGMAEKGSEEVGELYKGIDAASSAIPTIANRLNQIQDALRQFPAGGWASGRANVETFLQGAGRLLQVDPKTVNDMISKIGGDLSAQQVFHALINQYAIDQLKQVAQGTGRVMNAEVMTFLNGISENTDPRAIENLLNTQGRRALQVMADKVNKFTPFIRQAEQGQGVAGRDSKGQLMYFKPQDYAAWYATQSMDVNNLPQNFGGIDIAPRNPMEAKGVPEALGPTRGYYNRATGKFETAPPATPNTIQSP